MFSWIIPLRSPEILLIFQDEIEASRQEGNNINKEIESLTKEEKEAEDAFLEEIAKLANKLDCHLYTPV